MSYPDADLVRVFQPPGRDGLADLVQLGLGAGEQLFAGAGPVGFQHRVVAADQPLAGVVRAGDLGEPVDIEQAHLQRAVVSG